MKLAWILPLPTFILLALTMAACGSTAHAQVNRNGGAVAIDGYDPVAYFTDRRPVRGSAEHSAEHAGATWWFASADNRRRFLENPRRHAPAYGGYCAYAVSQGRTARIDPRAWSIVGGRLYLNYSLEIRDRWNADREEHIRRADANWPDIARGLR